MKLLPSQNYIENSFNYDINTGVIVWKKRPPDHFKNIRSWKAINSRYENKVAGCLKKDGYLYLSLQDCEFMAHRLIWKLVTGLDPIDQVDHINNNRSDNRFSNLRQANNSENQYNSKIAKNNSSGFKGVSFQKASGKWEAYIWKNYKKFYLGIYTTKEEAAKEYDKASIELFGSFAKRNYNYE